MAKLENVSSSIKYENILNEIDLKYDVKANKIKESITINDKSGIQDEFVFRFDVGKLKAILLENKEILIMEEGSDGYIFKIEAPYMFDNNCEYSSDIDVELNQDKLTDEYILTIKPSREWMEAEDRVYPITIDPTITTTREYNYIEDTYIFQGDESSNTRHRAHIIRVGSNNKAGPHKNPTRGLIKFSLPDLNAGDQVIWANLSLCSYPDTDEWAPPGREVQVDVHRINTNWSQETASWNSLSNSYNTIIEDYEKYKFDYNDQLKFYNFNITDIAKDWYTTGNNYGLMIKEHNEQYNYPESDAYFLSANTNKEAWYYGRPVVTIVYRNQTGLEDYLSYHTQSVGRAGTVYTNDYNGNLVLVHQDAATPGNRFPVSINHVFNTNNKGTNLGYGKGYRLNLTQTIEQQTIDGTEYLRYTDEDGTAHYFPKSGNEYKDEDGLALTIYPDGSNYRLEDKNGNKSIFTKLSSGNIWYLTKTTDTDGNVVNITIDLATGRPSKIVDGANQELNLTYQNNLLYTITDSAGRITKFTYTADKLTQIEYSDGKKSNYTYNDNGTLSSITNIDGIKLGYEYYQEKTTRVKKIQEYGANGEIGNSLSIQYGDNSTIFTDNRGYSNSVAFNNYGNPTSIADFGKNNSVDGAYGKTYSYGESGGNKNKLTLESKLMSIKEMPNNLIQNPYFNSGLNYWTKDQCKDSDTVEYIDNNNVFKFIGESNRYKYLRQNVSISGKKGDIFNLSAWVKSAGVPTEHWKIVQISANVIGNNGDASQWAVIPANLDSSSWQFISNQFITNYDYSRVDVYLICYENANATYFDNIGLFREDFGQSYTYDSEGNIVSTQDKAKQESQFTYNGTGELLSSINPKGGRFIYEYDFNNKNRLIKAVNNTGTTYSFNYDNYGNVTSSKVSESRELDTIENNEKYYMKIASSDKYFNIAGSSTNNGAKLEQLEQLGKESQKFILEPQNNYPGYYKIRGSHNIEKSLAVDASDNSIHQWESFNFTSHYWKFIENDDGTYRVVNEYCGDDYCITLKNDSKSNGELIVLEKWEGKQNQKVEIFKVNSGYNPTDDDKIESNELYHIRVKSSNLYLEQEYNNVGAKIIQNPYKPYEPKQLWRIVRLENGRYKIINQDNLRGNVIDVIGAINQNGQLVQMYTNTIPNPAQEWYIRGDKTGTYEIGTALSDEEKRLTVYTDSKEPGTAMCIFEPNGGDNQKFYLEKANLFEIESGATYKIKGHTSGLYVGVNDNGRLELQNENSQNQEWIIENRNDGYYKFKLKGSDNKVMDVYGAYTENGTDIQIHTDTGSDAQKYEIIARTDGTYYIKPKIGNGSKSVDIYGGATTVGTSIKLWESNGTPAQIYELVKIESNDSRKYIETNAEYSEDGRYQTKLIDTSGNEVQYEYNETTGTIKEVTDAKGNTTNYEYDGLDRVTKVSAQANSQTHQNEYTYENDRIKSIKHNGTNYYFEYDSFGNQKTTKIGTQVLGTSTYAANNGVLNSFTYGNNHKITYEYDRFDRLTKKTGTNGSIEYAYDAKGNLKEIKDNINSNTENYTYDLADRLVKKENTNGLKAEYFYDNNSNVNKTKYTLGTDSKETRYNYDRDNRINSVITENDIKVTNYDRLSRIVNTQLKRNNKTYVTRYQYVDTEEPNRTTEKVKSIQNGEGTIISYTYDANGNIETISEGEGEEKEETQKYYYDEIGQLIRENNKKENKTIVYTYDVGGNITSKKEYAYTEGNIEGATVQKTITYTYGNTNWKDQLTNYNGKAITYDAIGNPLTYDGQTYTWQNGRELGKIQKGSNVIEYKYNESGIRTSKKINGQETKYYLEGNNVIYETTGNNTIYYRYDENGNITGINYNGQDYYYIKNIQNDIIGILNSNLEEIVNYQYDSWGQVVKVTDSQGNEITDTNNIGYINPYRYRSYRYDSETKLYYLNSRYYNPEWGRFINADAIVDTKDTLGINLYAYCGNNPVNRVDKTGKGWISAFFKATVATVVTIVKVIVDVKKAVSSIASTKTYTNSVTKSEEGGYTAHTKINKKDYIYKINNRGDIAIDYTKNPSYSIIEGKTLSKAMIENSKQVNINSLDNRTLRGINAELDIHYGAYILTKAFHGKTDPISKFIDEKIYLHIVEANMGGYSTDDNARYFEYISMFVNY